MNYKKFLSDLFNVFFKKINSDVSYIDSKALRIWHMQAHGAYIHHANHLIYFVRIYISSIKTYYPNIIKSLELNIKIDFDKKLPKSTALICEVELDESSAPFLKDKPEKVDLSKRIHTIIDKLEDEKINYIKLENKEVNIDFDYFVDTITKFIDERCIPVIIQEMNTFEYAPYKSGQVGEVPGTGTSSNKS